jgi:F-type H+-transporting ATPase subunit b
MRKALLVLLLMFVGFTALAQANNPPDVAHGAEKVGAEAAHPGEDVGGPHEGPKFLGMPAWIWKFINMVLFLGALVYFLGGPLKKAYANRAETIRKTAEEADARRAKAEQLAADIQARLAQIENDVKAIHERAEAEGERQRKELIAAAETEAARILQNARSEVDNKLKSARHELAAYAAELASDRAEQILRDTITTSDQQKLFAESVKEVAEVRS